MPEISLTRPPAWTALGERWRALETRSDASFFQSWSWVGSHAAARFPDPWLLTAEEGGRIVALGLFNRRASWPWAAQLWLGESGRPALDMIHVEHNGLLLARDAPPGLLAMLLTWLLRRGSVVLGGVGAAHAAAAAQVPAVRRDLAHPARAHVVDLAAVRAAPGGHLALLSANARQQIRRSLRRYGQAGPLRVDRAASLDQARAHLAALGRLHQETWTRRGQPGAFANPDFVAFHAALLEAAWPRGEIDLLRVAAQDEEGGQQVLGYLYNFVWRGRVANYQSGFDYAAAASAHQKPGLTCHHLAVEMYAAEGQGIYDLLAGNDRYKSSLANGGEALHWFELLPPTSLPGLVHRLRQALGRG